MATGSMPAPPTMNKPSMSDSFSPASASTPAVFSACICATDRSGMTRSGCSKAPTTYALPLILTLSSPRRNLYVQVGQCLDLFEGEPVGDFVDDKRAIDPPQDSQVGHYHVYAICARQRKLCPPHQFWPALAIAMLHHHDQLLLASHEVHSAADAAQARIAQAEIRQAALLVDLIRTQHHGVQLAAACHLKRGH